MTEMNNRNNNENQAGFEKWKTLVARLDADEIRKTVSPGLERKISVRTLLIVGGILMFLSAFARLEARMSSPTPSTVSAGINAMANLADSMAEKEPTIDVEYINVRLQDLGELTTAELSYDGLLRYDEGSIPLLTKHGFLMTYSSHARAGIDFAKVRVRVSGDSVKVIIPRSEIQLIYVDPESICFYDESHALFQGDEKEDLQTALVDAEADAREHLDLDSVLSRADSRAELMICDLISEIAGDVEIEVERR